MAIVPGVVCALMLFIPEWQQRDRRSVRLTMPPSRTSSSSVA
jgi:hypothetical protein